MPSMFACVPVFEEREDLSDVSLRAHLFPVG
jgi:hypothetical protein